MRSQINKAPFETVLQKLFNVSIFNDFSADKESDVEMFKALYQKFSAESYDDGDIIIKEGEQGENLYILFHGSIQIFRKTQFDDEIAIADLDDSFDVFFGEAALVDQDQRSATVRAVGKCEVLVLNGSDFVEFCKQYPILGFYVYRKITKRMQQVIKRSYKDITTLYAALFREIEGSN